MSNTQSALATALGVIQPDEPAKNIVPLKLNNNIPDEEKAKDDAHHARETLRDMIEKNNEAITDLMSLAKGAQSARHFEVLAQMIHNNADVASRLLKLHDDHQKVQNNAINLARNKGGAVGNNSSGAVSIQNGVVFMGTTKELLAMIKSTQDKQIIDAEFKDNEKVEE